MSKKLPPVCWRNSAEQHHCPRQWRRESQYNEKGSKRGQWRLVDKGEMQFDIVKKAQKSLYFLRGLRKVHLPPSILTIFYRECIESILCNCITPWFGSCTTLDLKTLQRIVKSAKKIIGGSSCHEEHLQHTMQIFYIITLAVPIPSELQCFSDVNSRLTGQKKRQHFL
ncbi:uncharacterized protein [Narcine bancroftii]|uniref:uncharacterized protein isoform X2 n=1 Tax=Narcine bancroftii TaxID=1343680 RepID=UPI003831DFE2